MKILNWIQEWYKTQCDGEWEHEYGIKVHTIDNPGWSMSIDLVYTQMEHIQIEYQLFEKSETDWYAFSIQGSVYHAAGDPNKLEFLLTKFKELTEQYGKSDKK